MIIVNITTYYFNITKANLGEPEWEIFHNVLNDYGMEDASPESLPSIRLEKLRIDEETALKYNYWNAKGGPGLIQRKL